jgi:hypothetical protein
MQGGDDDDDHEFFYVVLELPEGHLSQDETYQLIGLDTPTPILKLGNAVFRGSHEDVLGTHLVFSDAADLVSLPGSAKLPAPTQAAGAAVAQQQQQLERSNHHLIGQATQKICFERVLLEPRQAAEEDEAQATAATAGVA